MRNLSLSMGLHHQVENLLILANQSLLQRLNSFNEESCRIERMENLIHPKVKNLTLYLKLVKKKKNIRIFVF